MIGECFQFSDEICGVVINVRNKANKLCGYKMTFPFIGYYDKYLLLTALWTKDSRNSRAILSIGTQMKELLQLGELELQYQLHTDAMVQHGPNVHSIYKL